MERSDQLLASENMVTGDKTASAVFISIYCSATERDRTLYGSCLPHKLLSKQITHVSNTQRSKKLEHYKKHAQPNKNQNQIVTGPQHRKLKWAAFTYTGKETRKVTDLLTSK
jgi:hypothetical protein